MREGSYFESEREQASEPNQERNECCWFEVIATEHKAEKKLATTGKLATGDTREVSAKGEQLTMPDGSKLIFKTDQDKNTSTTWRYIANRGGEAQHSEGITTLTHPATYDWSLRIPRPKIDGSSHYTVLANCSEVDGIVTMTFPNSDAKIIFDKDGIRSIKRGNTEITIYAGKAGKRYSFDYDDDANRLKV